MVQVIEQQGNIFGRLGSGIGKGLSEQVPREIQRNRLASGLESLNKEGSKLSSQEFYTKALSVPGLIEHPEAVRQLGEFARHRAKGEALRDLKDQEKPQNPFAPNAQETRQSGENSKVPSLTNEENFQKTQEGWIPRTEQEKMQAAGEKYNTNPARFGNNPQEALDYEDKVDATNEKVANANQKKHKTLSGIQDNIVNRLAAQSERLKAKEKIPSKLYSKIEDDAIQSTKPKKEGGRGLTEQQAIKEYGGQLDDVAKDYKKITPLTGLSLYGSPSRETLRVLKGLQANSEKRGDTEEMADQVQADLKISPQMSYAIFEPVSRVPEANKFIKSLPKLEPFENFFGSAPNLQTAVPKTFEIAPKLAAMLTNNPKLSPLAVAYELEKSGYDPKTWLEYVSTNRKALNLKENQTRQLDTRKNVISPINDWWFGSWSGLE